MKLIIFICLGSFALLTGIHYYFFKFDIEFLEVLNINLISSFLLLFLTLFFLDRMIRRHTKNAEKERKKSEYKAILKQQHLGLISDLTKPYTLFILGNTKSVEIEEALANLNKNINVNFLRRRYTLTFIDPHNIFAGNNKEISYQEFSHKYFKPQMFNGITEYISKYAAIIPEEVMHSLFIIESTIKTNIFVIPEDHGVSFDISYGEIDYDALKEQLRKIGNELKFLREYIE